ncbi:MAG: acetylesterase, partial [Clostridia bacterium]|nr:acetylesterase [Clostridia bacterium]
MAILQMNFFSAALMRTVDAVCVIPNDKRGFDGKKLISRETPMKTLYLLHGLYGSQLDWLTRTRIARLADAKNLAVIMPAGENKFYSDRRAHDHFGRFVGQDLVEYSRDLFHLSDRREDTYIAGLSMGGFGA